MATIQERIKSRRLEKGFTLLELANKLDVQEATMQRYESGEIKNIKHDTIVKLAKILHCTPQYLMGWVDTPIDYNAPLSSTKNVLLTSFDTLNPAGQDKAVEYVADLADNPKYQLTSDKTAPPTTLAQKPTKPQPYIPHTLAAHNDNATFSEADQDDIARFIAQHVAPKNQK